MNHETQSYLSNNGVVERCDIVKDSIDSLESIDGRVHLSIDTIVRLVVVLQRTAYFPVCLTRFSYLILLILHSIFYLAYKSSGSWFIGKLSLLKRWNSISSMTFQSSFTITDGSLCFCCAFL